MPQVELIVQVRVVATDELGPAELEAWRAIQRGQESLSSAFLAPEFAQAVGRARPDARVAVVEDRSGYVGFFAFQEGSDKHGTPIGAGICDAQAFICRPELDWDPRWLVRACGLTSWQFDHLRTEQSQFGPFHRALHRSPVIDLTAGHDAFLATVATISKDVLAQVRRRRRKLAREIGPVVTTWSEAEALEPNRALFAWKSAQYAATGTWDRFEQPWIRDVLEDLQGSAAPDCAGVLATTRAGGRLAAVHLGLGALTSLSWWFPTYDPELGRFSPGLILLLDLAEFAAERGLSMVDLGRGEHGYKMRVSNGGYMVAEGEVPSRTRG